MASAAAAAAAALAAGFVFGEACGRKDEPVPKTPRRAAVPPPPKEEPRREPRYEPRQESKHEPNHDEAQTIERWEGFSMKEAMALADAKASEAMRRSPVEVYQDLQRGNARFWTGNAQRPKSNAFERRALIAKQFPLTAVLGCSDSRVPIEIVFDQGLGDLFVIRVAGNCLATSTTASLQFAVKHLKVKVVLVMGHEMCGAVKAAQLDAKKLEAEPLDLQTALKGIKTGLNEKTLHGLRDNRALDREAATTNVKVQVEKLMEDPMMKDKVDNGDLVISGAFYEISSGIVDFFSTNMKDPSSPKSTAAPTSPQQSTAAPTSPAKVQPGVGAARPANVTVKGAQSPPISVANPGAGSPEGKTAVQKVLREKPAPQYGMPAGGVPVSPPTMIAAPSTVLSGEVRRAGSNGNFPMMQGQSANRMTSPGR